MTASSSWPKSRATLTADQERILEDWYAYWLRHAPHHFGWIDSFNHRYPLRMSFKGARTLEIGAGVGSHLRHEDLGGEEEYVAVELRPDFARAIRESFPSVRVLIGDCQERLDLPEAHFDRVLAIHVLEHLTDLPNALREIRR